MKGSVEVVVAGEGGGVMKTKEGVGGGGVGKESRR